MTTLRIAPPAPEKATFDPAPGEGADRFAALVHAIYQDRRANAQARELLHAMAYAVTVGRTPDLSVWQAAGRALGSNNIGRPRIKELAALDIPRYVRPGQDSYATGSCAAARHRPYVPRNATQYGKAKASDDWRNTDRLCGAHGTIHVAEKDPQTGWHILRWYCSRHRAEADRVTGQLRAQNDAAPSPIPNRGGLLPAYFKADWTKVYRWARDSVSWEPPSWGICADDWPVPGQDAMPHRSRLRLVLGGADLEGEQ